MLTHQHKKVKTFFSFVNNLRVAYSVLTACPCKANKKASQWHDPQTKSKEGCQNIPKKN